MSDHVDFLLLGLGNGAVYAALAVAIVIVYRSVGGPELRHRSHGAAGGTDLRLLATGVAPRAHSGCSRPPWESVGRGDSGRPSPSPWRLRPSFGRAVVLRRSSGPSGGAAGRWRRRWRRSASWFVLSGLVAQRAVGRPSSGRARSSRAGRIEAAGSFITTDRLYLALTILGLAVSAHRASIASPASASHTRAAAETEVGAFVSGLSPDRIGAANWALERRNHRTGRCAHLAAHSRSAPRTYTLFVVPSDGGRGHRPVHSHDPRGADRACAIGMLQSEIVSSSRARYDWMPDSGSRRTGSPRPRS